MRDGVLALKQLDAPSQAACCDSPPSPPACASAGRDARCECPESRRQSPTSVSPSHAPITCPPIFGASEKMRSGTSSLSANPHTSFCKRDAGAKFLQLGAVAQRDDVCASRFFLLLRFLPQRLHLVERRVRTACVPARAACLPDIQSGGGTCGSSCAAPTRDRARDSARCSPARTTGRQPRLPVARAAPEKSSRRARRPLRQPTPGAARARDTPPDSRAAPRSPRSACRTVPRCSASRSRHCATRELIL